MSDLFLDEIVRPQDDEPGGRRARRAERAERDRRRKQRRRRVVATVIVLAVIGGGAVAVTQLGMPILDGLFASEEEPAADYPGPGHSSVDVVIPAGATGGQMAQILFDGGVVASPEAFIAAFTATPEAAGIQPGTYRLLMQMKASDALTALMDRSNRVQTQVTIPEGFRVEQILERLAAVTAIPMEEFQAAMEDPAAVGLPAEADGQYEGWLFPDTYAFEPGTTAAEMISAMTARTIQVLDDNGVAARDRHRVLTIASLIEREARTEEDRRKVARAILNRLDGGWTLDIDAAVAYGLNKPGTELTNADKDVDTPYNLYMHGGLPPTPIASPSEMSIRAVLDPADGPWMFWVTVNLDTGETRFAETYAEHQRNVDELRRWQAENSG